MTSAIHQAKRLNPREHQLHKVGTIKRRIHQGNIMCETFGCGCIQQRFNRLVFLDAARGVGDFEQAQDEYCVWTE